jgi:hypothetical protein
MVVLVSVIMDDQSILTKQRYVLVRFQYLQEAR